MKQNSRIAYLDGVRGIAAVIVVFYHYFLSFYPGLFVLNPGFTHTDSAIEHTLTKTPFSIFYSGGLAVAVFFVLSGYVLSHKFFISRSYNYLASSAVKRYFRLGIPIFVSVIISYIILSFNGYTNSLLANVYTKSTFWFAGQWNIQPNIWEALKEGSYSALLEAKSINYNSVLWTMNVEFIGSMLVFGTLALFIGLNKRWIIYLVLILTLKVGVLSAFVMGMAICDYYTSKERTPLSTTILLPLTLLAIYFGSYQDLKTDTIWSPLDFFDHITRGMTFQFAAALFILIVINSQRTQTFLSHRFFGFLGKISFSLYLIHLLILGSLSCFLFRYFYDQFSLTYFSSFILMFFIAFPFTLFMSYLMYRFVDSAAIKFSAYFYNKVFKPSAQS